MSFNPRAATGASLSARVEVAHAREKPRLEYWAWISPCTARPSLETLGRGGEFPVTAMITKGPPVLCSVLGGGARL